MDPMLITATIAALASMIVMLTIVWRIGRTRSESAARVEVLRTLAASDRAAVEVTPPVRQSGNRFVIVLSEANGHNRNQVSFTRSQT